MDFILNSKFFDTTISILVFINVIFTLILSFGELKDDLSKKDNKNLTKIETFKMVTIVIYAVIIAILLTILAGKYNFLSYLSIIHYLSFAIIAKKLFKKNIGDLTAENKMSYIMTSYLFLIFFSTKATQIYLTTPLNAQHIFKEYLLISFLSIKIIFFIFCLIMNLSILASNFALLFNKPLKRFKDSANKFIGKTYELNLYDFYFSKKYSKKFIIIDIIIFIILCPILMITYVALVAILTCLRFLLKIAVNTGTKIINYFNNSAKIIPRALKISVILSLLIVYIITVYNSNVIYEQTKDVYSLLITVILIPIIYDSIKSR